MRTVAITQGLHTPSASATCCMCGATVMPCHHTRECALLDLFRIAIHTQVALAISGLVPCWSVNCVTLSGIQIFCGNSLFGISVGPAALTVPLAYPCANLAFTDEVTPADEKLLLNRGITRSAVHHTLGFVLRTVVPIHSRYCLPAIPSLPDHCTHISDNEGLFMSWIEHSLGKELPSTRLFSAPRAIQRPQPAILRCVVAVFAMSLSIHRFITGRGITQGPPTPSLYWFSATHLQGSTPPLFFAHIRECIFDPPTRIFPLTPIMVVWFGLWNTGTPVGISTYGSIPSCLLVTDKQRSGLL